MSHHTWYDLADHFCAREKSLIDGGKNKYFERLAARRYNYANKNAAGTVRLVFLNSVAKNKINKTLSRAGRFVWCKNLKYEGKGDDGYRKISFTIGSGGKRFFVCESNVLAIPHNTYINNNSYFRNYNKVFGSFASVFDYRDAIKVMKRNSSQRWDDLESYESFLQQESPFKTGTLVCARKGLFFPRLSKFQEKIEELVDRYCVENYCTQHNHKLKAYLSGRDYITRDKKLQGLFDSFIKWCAHTPEAMHPVGVVVGRSRNVSPYSGKELYRVSFADTIYEEVHPIQMEVLNEV